MKQLNVGMSGLGRLGKVYAIDLAHRIPNAHLVAVADTQEQQAMSFARDYNISKWYSNYKELLADKNVDAVAVVTPTNTHGKIVIEAAHAGKAIFCEKPISISLGEAVEIEQTIESTGVFFQWAFNVVLILDILKRKRKLMPESLATLSF